MDTISKTMRERARMVNYKSLVSRCNAALAMEICRGAFEAMLKLQRLCAHPRQLVIDTWL